MFRRKRPKPSIEAQERLEQAKKRLAIEEAKGHAAQELAKAASKEFHQIRTHQESNGFAEMLRRAIAGDSK